MASRKCPRAGGLVCLLLVALAGPASSFMVPITLSPFPMAVRPAATAASPYVGAVQLQLRRGAASLRMADAPSTEGTAEDDVADEVIRPSASRSGLDHSTQRSPSLTWHVLHQPYYGVEDGEGLGW